MKAFNIYLCGVGGQGIGLLSEVLLRAGDYAGLAAKAVDTHGLAQRGGSVISQLRFGQDVFSPMIPARQADLVVALERHEALRGADLALRDRGTLIYFDTSLQPLGVRLGSDREVSPELLERSCGQRDITVHRVENSGLDDPRMQNIALLSRISGLGLVPELTAEHILKALEDLMDGAMLAQNTALFQVFHGAIPAHTQR